MYEVPAIIGKVILGEGIFYRPFWVSIFIESFGCPTYLSGLRGAHFLSGLLGALPIYRAVWHAEAR